MLDPQVGKSVVCPRTSVTVRELLWYNCSAVCGPSAQWLNDGDNGNLLQEDLGHTLRLPGLLQPEPLSPRQPLLTPCLCRRCSDTHRQVWLSLCGVSGSCAHKVSFEPSQHFWWVWGFILNTILLLLPTYCGFSFALGWEYILVGSNILLSMVIQWLVAILEFLQEKMSTCPSTPPFRFSTQCASKFGKLSSGHSTGKGQFSLQSQREAMPKTVQTSAQLHLSHILARRRQWHPTPVLLPGKSHGQRSLVGCSPWGREESDMTERLHFPFSLSCIGEGNGNPLQCSCLENPRDGGAWWGHTELDTTEAT